MLKKRQKSSSDVQLVEGMFESLTLLFNDLGLRQEQAAAVGIAYGLWLSKTVKLPPARILAAVLQVVEDGLNADSQVVM